MNVLESPPREALAALSREFSLACDREGRITWTDERFTRLMGTAPGASFVALAPRGLEEKASELLRQGRLPEGVEGWELALVMGHVPVTVSFSARPWGEQVLLVGQLLPEAFHAALAQLSDSMEEVVSLNRQIASQKKEIERRHDEVVALNGELAESHRGVLTMHSELADRAEELSNVAELRSRIVSHVSHEFRTPLHSILGLSRLLAEQSDGPLTEEQLKQVGFIRTSAQELVQFVDDLLDLSKAEAGKSTLRIEKFDLAEFLGSMRGVLKPLLPADSPVELAFDLPEPGVEVETDRPKLAQVLRNLVSNAIKFTEQGEVRVRTRVEGGQVSIEVADTGIGIAPEHRERIFEEFGQLDNPIQSRVKGTGLGLPLSRKLAQMLGGDIALASEPGRGSTFTLTIPAEHAEAREMQALVQRSRRQPAGPGSILVVEDDRKTLFIYEKYLAMAGFHVLPARTIDEARDVIRHARPAAIVLDIMLEGETSWAFLADLKRSPETRDIPVLVVTVTNREQKARALGADEFWLKPVDQERLLKRLKSVARTAARPRVLVIDDDERARYIVRKHLAGMPYEVTEAATGSEGVVLAQQGAPHVILLDFLLPGMTAFDVLDELKSDPRTRQIPVIIVTSHDLNDEQQRRLLLEAEAVISKQNLSRELAINRIRDALAKVGVMARGAA